MYEGENYVGRTRAKKGGGIRTEEVGRQQRPRYNARQGTVPEVASDDITETRNSGLLFFSPDGYRKLCWWIRTATKS